MAERTESAQHEAEEVSDEAMAYFPVTKNKQMMDITIFMISVPLSVILPEC